MLQKEPRGREVNDGDNFVFNREFTAKLHRIKINSIQLKETSEENEKTHEAVFRDRQYQVRTSGHNGVGYLVYSILSCGGHKIEPIV